MLLRFRTLSRIALNESRAATTESKRSSTRSIASFKRRTTLRTLNRINKVATVATTQTTTNAKSRAIAEKLVMSFSSSKRVPNQEDGTREKAVFVPLVVVNEILQNPKPTK